MGPVCQICCIPAFRAVHCAPQAPPPSCPPPSLEHRILDIRARRPMQRRINNLELFWGVNYGCRQVCLFATSYFFQHLLGPIRHHPHHPFPARGSWLLRHRWLHKKLQQAVFSNAKVRTQPRCQTHGGAPKQQALSSLTLIAHGIAL